MSLIDTLFGSLRRHLAGFPDKRQGKSAGYPMADIGMGAFSAFFMQSPSFLAHQRQLAEGYGRSNLESLFGITRIPTDNYIREMLDPASPDLLHPVFDEVAAQLQHLEGGLDTFRRLGNHVLIALDGTEYHCSEKIHCPDCSTRTHGKEEAEKVESTEEPEKTEKTEKAADTVMNNDNANVTDANTKTKTNTKTNKKGARKNSKNGKKNTERTEYFHSMLAATIVAPGHDKVIPLVPEFMTPQDGALKQDCENRAAKRWLASHGQSYADLNPVYLGDDLFSRQPLCEAVLAAGGHFLFVCKPSSHPLIQEYVTGIDLPRVENKVRRGKTHVIHRYRWLNDVPLRDGKDALLVNWLEIEIVNPDGKVTYRNSFITDLPVGPNNVADLAACGRARWKIENETFNVLKTKGYNLEHNFGHGKQNLASILVLLNLLAFAFHTLCDIGDELWRAARAKQGPRYNFFAKLAGITAFLIFSSWRELLLTIAFAQPPPLPP